MPAAALPLIVEVKRRLAGGEESFSCRVLDRGAEELVVLFVADRARQVAGVALPAGTVTFGYFWTDRPWNAYHWMSPAGETLGCYFNVADELVVGEASFAWRDLVADVLVAPGCPARILDADDLPASVAPDLRRRVAAATRDLVARAPDLAREIEARSRALWPRVSGETRP